MGFNGLSMPLALQGRLNCRQEETELFLTRDIWLSRGTFFCRPAPTTVLKAGN